MSLRPTTWLLGILLVAFALRAGTAITLQSYLDRQQRDFLVPGDAEGYGHLGRQIARGEEYSVYTPPRRVLRMPGFPAVLALSMTLFGEGRLPARLLLCGVGTVACGLVYWLGRELVDPPTGLIAAALAAIHPTLIGFSPLILSETLFAACLLASLIAMAAVGGGTFRPPGPECGARRLERSWSPFCAGAVVAGALIGVACYVRPSWLLAAPVFGVLLVLLPRGTGARSHLQDARHPRGPDRSSASGPAGAARTWAARAAGGALVCAAALLVLVPWGLRNQRVTGHFVLTTLWVGPSLYDGLHPQATGESDMTFYDRDNLMARGMTEYEVDRHYRRQAWRFVREQPGRAVELAFVKLWRFVKPWPTAEQFRHWWLRLAVAGSFVSLIVLAARGGWELRRRTWALLLSAGPLLYFAAIHMVFVSSLRYRLPAEYPLLVLSAAGLRAWCPAVDDLVRARSGGSEQE